MEMTVFVISVFMVPEISASNVILLVDFVMDLKLISVQLALISVSNSLMELARETHLVHWDYIFLTLSVKLAQITVLIVQTKILV
jgi:hypothetical protein